ncbi:MAG: DUF370 domain-containing protein [Defluviitaleaceae bacterium]|nr:DUF370 domain-containing protein [Defluviitaleaceae bacterium]
MGSKLINVGFGNTVPAGRIIAIVGNDSLPVKRNIGEAKEKHMLVDATQGRKTRAVVYTDSGHLVLSALQPETIANRFETSNDAVSGEI